MRSSTPRAYRDGDAASVPCRPCRRRSDRRPGACVLCMPDIWGLRPLFEDMATSLSERTGWSVARRAVPRPGARRALDPDGIVRPIAGAAIAVRRRPARRRRAPPTDARLGATRPVGLIGFCMGGMYALKAAATDRFDRTVAFYGMIRVPDGWAAVGPGSAARRHRRSGRHRGHGHHRHGRPYTPPDRSTSSRRPAWTSCATRAPTTASCTTRPVRPTGADDAADAWRRVLAFLGRRDARCATAV